MEIELTTNSPFFNSFQKEIDQVLGEILRNENIDSEVVIEILDNVIVNVCGRNHQVEVFHSAGKLNVAIIYDSNYDKITLH
jgi:altronate dehydratase